MKCETCDLDSLKTYKYVVIFAKHDGKWVFCKHKQRATWETAGGHIEKGETPLDAAKRELYEESGAEDFTITPACDYWAADDTYSNKKHSGQRRRDSRMEWLLRLRWHVSNRNKYETSQANGVVFYADINRFGSMPDSEMERAELFDDLPTNLTYPGITPVLFEYIKKHCC